MNEHAESCPCRVCDPAGKGDHDAALSTMRAALAKPQTSSVDDMRRFAIPPGAREERFARHFSQGQILLLRHTYALGDTQIQRLTAALRAVAYYTRPAPELREVRKPLDALVKNAHKTVQGLEALLLAPAHEEARVEARDRIRDAVAALHPGRCQPDPARTSPFHEHDERIEEAMRMLAAVRAVEAVAKRALTGIPSSATKTTAHPYPIACIDAALKAGENETAVTPSASSTSSFREIIGICYEAAGAGTTDPETAIRAYLKTLRASEKSS